MFSAVPSQLARIVSPRRSLNAVAAATASIDLTASNPTRAGFAYPADLLAPLADPDALRYDPQPLGRDRRALSRSRRSTSARA
jgi:hypothetical protein